jgi:hypothetical protein
MRTTSYPSRPAFVVDPNSVGSTQGRQISWADVPNRYKRGALSVVVNGAHLAGVTTLNVDALGAQVPGGGVIDFGGGKTAVAGPAGAAGGATTITILPLAAAVADNAVGYYQPKGQESAGKVLPAGKVMCEKTDRTLVPRSDRPGAETASQILKTPAAEDSTTDSLSGYGTYDEGRFFENLLPDADPATGLISSTYKTELRAAGGSWRFEQYEDSRG